MRRAWRLLSDRHDARRFAQVRGSHKITFAAVLRLLRVTHHGLRSRYPKPQSARQLTVIVPRRSINGQLVFGKVWRRHDGRDWIYKKFVEYGDDEAA